MSRIDIENAPDSQNVTSNFNSVCTFNNVMAQDGTTELTALEDYWFLLRLKFFAAATPLVCPCAYATQPSIHPETA